MNCIHELRKAWVCLCNLSNWLKQKSIPCTQYDTQDNSHLAVILTWQIDSFRLTQSALCDAPCHRVGGSRQIWFHVAGCGICFTILHFHAFTMRPSLQAFLQLAAMTEL